MADEKEIIRKIEEFEQEEELPSQEKKVKKKKTGWKYALNISLVLIATTVALVLTLYSNFTTIIDNLSSANFYWILAIVGIILLMMLVRGTILTAFARLYTRKYHLHQGVAVDQVGTFYNAVTPGGSGGEFMQAYTFKKQGVPISSAVSMMAMYSIVYQTVLILYGIVSFIIKYDKIIGVEVPILGLKLPMWLLTVIGFLLNVSVILLILLMSYWKGFHRFMTGPMISLLSKIRIIKNPDQSRERLRVQVENFKIELRRLLANIPFTILVAVLFFVMLTLRFCIPYFVGIALHNESTVASFWDSVFLCNFHQMVTGLIPIPGSAGVSEWFFHELFINKSNIVESFYVARLDGIPDIVASDALCQSALLVWRSMTFAIPLFIAGFVTAFYKASPKEQTRDGDVPSRGTLVSLQAETLVQRTHDLDTMIETQTLNRRAIMEKLKATKKKKHEKKDEPFDDDIKKIDIDED